MKLDEHQTEQTARIILEMHKLKTSLKRCEASTADLVIMDELSRAGIHMGRFLRGATFGAAALQRQEDAND